MFFQDPVLSAWQYMSCHWKGIFLTINPGYEFTIMASILAMLALLFPFYISKVGFLKLPPQSPTRLINKDFWK